MKDQFSDFYFRKIESCAINNELRHLENLANSRPPVSFEQFFTLMESISAVVKPHENQKDMKESDPIVFLGLRYNSMIRALNAHKISHSFSPFVFEIL
jgi:hypothetical protein